jgi:co-chaperonin GroES (HSP10)
MVKKTKALGEGLFEAGGSVKYTHEIKKLIPIGDNVIVRNMNFEARQLSSGILLLNDDGKTNGIRPRWAQVYAIGPDQTDVEPGQWVLIEHGRWSRGVQIRVDDEEFIIRRVDPKCIIFSSDEEPSTDDNISDAVYAERKERY